MEDASDKKTTTKRKFFFKDIDQTQRTFKVGDKVLVKKNGIKKDEDRYEGPAEVIKKIHERSYEVKYPDETTKVRNVEWLRFFKEGGC